MQSRIDDVNLRSWTLALLPAQECLGEIGACLCTCYFIYASEQFPEVDKAEGIASFFFYLFFFYFFYQV